jgi:hypothetical protein
MNWQSSCIQVQLVANFIMQSTARYMVDYQMYQELEKDHEEHNRGKDASGNANEDASQESEVEEIEDEKVDVASTEPPGDPFLLLLPPMIKGFGLHDKRWSK